MIIDKSIKRVTIGNTEIQKIMSGGGILWQKNTVPGPTKLIGGNLQAGFYGEVPASEFITGDELASMIGLTAGISQFSDEPWLKFSYLGKIEFIAKKTIRYAISWDSLNAVNAIFGNKTIKIGDNTYKIRLMKGKTEGKQDDSSSFEGDINKGSEWNKLMLPIHKNAPSNWACKENVNSPTENWNVGYTDNDLLTENSVGHGSQSWCQENGSSKYNFLNRGYLGVSGAKSGGPSKGYYSCGWRPVLELVE